MRNQEIFYPKDIQDYQGFGRAWKRKGPDFTPRVGREGTGSIGGAGEEANRGQAQPLGAETAGLLGLYMIDFIEVNSEIRDQEEVTW